MSKYQFDFSNMSAQDYLDFSVAIEEYNNFFGLAKSGRYRKIFQILADYSGVSLDQLPADEMEDFWNEGMRALRSYFMSLTPGAVWDDVVKDVGRKLDDDIL